MSNAPPCTLSHKIIPHIMSDSSACMVTPILAVTHTHRNHVSNIHTSLFPFLSDIAVPPVVPGSGDTVGVFSLSIFFSPLIVFAGRASFLAELFRGMLFKWKGANKKSHQK